VELTSLAPEQRTMEETWPDVEGLAPDEFIEQTRIATDDASERVSDIAMALAAPPGTFFDLAPLHLLTTSTLGKLSELHPDGAFDVRRYRPNVLVETAGASFLENDWINRRVDLGASAAMQVMLPTMRCIMTTMAQEDLPRDPSLLLTIARNNRIDIPGIGRWACAGVYGGVASPGTVRVGDPVSIG
jgi:uncharacterized protein YcbX